MCGNRRLIVGARRGAVLSTRRGQSLLASRGREIKERVVARILTLPLYRIDRARKWPNERSRALRAAMTSVFMSLWRAIRLCALLLGVHTRASPRKSQSYFGMQQSASTMVRSCWPRRCSLTTRSRSSIRRSGRNGRSTDTPLSALKRAARTAGFEFIRVGKVFQDWFVAFKEGNQTALRGAEEMRKVAWSAVIPKWEDPGWGPT